MTRQIVPIFLFLLAFASACSTSSPKPPSETYPQPNVQYPYPLSAYPEPNQNMTVFATLGSVPTPAEDSGIVVGTLLLKGKSVQNVTLYLAEMLKNDQGEEVVAGYDRSISPRAYLDAEGNFVFANVSPGNYSLILDFVLNSLLLGHPKSGEPILISVQAGETVKLGTLDYPYLPIPSQ